MPTPPKRIVFMGTPSFAVPSLQALLGVPQLATIAGVVTQPDRPAGRGRKLTPSPIKEAALAANLPVREAKKFRAEETLELLRSWAPELIVVAAFGRILPASMLTLPPLGCLNVHASLLPRHRGASPIARAIWDGDAHTGVCLMRMDEGLDTGDVYARASRPIAPHDTCGSLTDALAELGAGLLVTHLAEILAGNLPAMPQPSEGVTHAPPLSKADGELDFTCEAEQLARQIRALDPWPSTYAFCGAERIGVLGATAEPAAAPAEPGQVLSDAKGPYVACGSGILRLHTVKPAGRGAMDAAAWLRGRAQKPAVLSARPQTVDCA